MIGHRIIRDKSNGYLVRDLDLANKVKDAEVIRNNIEAKCLVIRGELPYDTSIGTPLGLDKESTDLITRTNIRTINGVKKIKRLTSSITNRKYNASAIIETIYGETLMEV